MKRFKYIVNVLGFVGTIAEIFIIGIYGCFMFAIGDLTIAYIEHREVTGVSLGEFLFTIAMFFGASIIMLFIARMVWHYRLYQDTEKDYE